MNLLISVVIPVVVLVLLVLIIGFFTSSETAYLSIQRITIRQLLKKDKPGAKNTPAQKIASLKSDMERLLTLVLIGVNFVTTLASSIAAALAIKLAGEQGATYATFIMAAVLIVFGEIIPKTIAGLQPVVIAEKFASALIVLQKILSPVVWLFSKIAHGITEVVGHIWKNDKSTITEDELKKLIDVGEHEGTLEQSEKKMLYKIFELTDLHVHDIMRHRSKVQYISLDSTHEEIINKFHETGYSRLPVCNGDFDHIVGVIHYKSVLFNSKGKSRTNEAQRYMKPALFVPESLTAFEMLQKFKKEKASFAVAVDENGSNSGIITMDDMLRAVFGRSVDEYPTEETSPEKRIKAMSPVEFILPGDLRLSDVNDVLDLDLESDNYDTLGGWLLEQFDALPSAGEMIKRDNVIYKVEDQSQRRIQSVRIRLPKPLAAERSSRIPAPISAGMISTKHKK